MSDDPLDRVRAFFGEEEPPKRRIGRYEILREVARGGMAIVYEARDPDLGRRVALKVLKEGNLERLRREASAAAKLRHPNVVAVHEVGPDFIAMDFVEGRSLAECLPGMGLRDRVRALETIARAVGAAHAEGVIHRDLKPANVIVEPGGGLVLTDFGLAKIAGGEDLTRTGSVAGTPHYMAPEQVRGEVRRIGPATDVWALGVVLCEMALDRKPFDGETALSIYEKITRDDPPALSGPLGVIAAKALERDPERRYPDGAAFAEDLRRYLEGEPLGTRAAGPAARLARRVRRSPVLYGLGALAAAAAAAALALALLGRAERARALAAVRTQARVSLEAALELRRAGANARMRQFLPPLEAAYREAVARAPRLAEVEYYLGRMHRALLEEEKALEYQERALGKDPGYAPALYERAVLLTLRHGRELRGAHEAAPETADQAEIERSHPDLARLRRAAAADCVAFLAGRRQDEGAAEVIAGILACHQGQTAEARQKLESAIQRDPLLDEAREALTQVARAEFMPGVEGRERSWQRAEEIYAQGIAGDQGYLPNYFGRGTLRWQRGSARRHRGLDPAPDYGSAEADFAEAARIDPSSAPAWTGCGHMRMYRALYLMETDQDPRALWASAEEALSKAVGLDARHAPAWMWRGSTRFYRGVWLEARGQDSLPEFEAAERDLSGALALDAKYLEALKWRGRLRAQAAAALGRRGRDPAPKLATAEEDFARAEALNARDSWMWTWRSTVASERALWRRSRGEDPEGDFAKAEGELGRAIEISPYMMEAWKHRGFVRWHRAQAREAAGERSAARESYAAAAADFHQALSINPTLRFQIGDRMETARRKAASE
jgi:serine/threonine-protein kinase